MFFLPGIDQVLEQSSHLHQRAGRVKLSGTAIIHDQNVVAVHNSIDPVRHCEGGSVLEFCAHDALNPGVRIGVDRGGGLVHNDDPRPAEQGPRDDQELPLADAEIGPALKDLV